MATPEPDTIGALLALLAHDLRNPLSALKSNLGFVASVTDRKETDVHEALVDSIASCDGLVSIIENVELVSGYLGGKHGPVLEPVILGTPMAEVSRQVQSLATSHGVTLELAEGAATSRVTVLAHREMLTRAFGNLVRNAVEHSRSGQSVRLEIRSRGDHASLAVIDGGSVISDAYLAQAFSAQGQLAMKGKPGGRYSRGLGLYCAWIAAQASGVTIEAGSEGGNNVFQLVARVNREV